MPYVNVLFYLNTVRENRMDNPEKLTIFGTQDAGRREAKHRKLKKDELILQ
jgi:hypothetical protein